MESAKILQQHFSSLLPQAIEKSDLTCMAYYLLISTTALVLAQPGGCHEVSALQRAHDVRAVLGLLPDFLCLEMHQLRVDPR